MAEKDIRFLFSAEKNRKSPDTMLSVSRLLITVNVALVSVSCILRCGQKIETKPTTFYFVAACTQSKMKMISAIYANDLDSCRAFARRKRGFAINYVQKELLHQTVRNYSGPTCLVYDCPELDVHTSLDTNTVFDYYSSYARPMPKTNVSCIPKVGIFQLHKVKKNFTEALYACEEEGGSLADITTEMHTIQLSSLIALRKVREAYVGLDQLQLPDEFITRQGVPLNCLKYRAWAPGEPRPLKGDKCAVLTLNEQWKAELCSKRLPFICELKPWGPFRPCRRLRNRRRRDYCVKKFRSSLPTKRRYPKCGAPLEIESAEQFSTKRRRQKHRPHRHPN